MVHLLLALIYLSFISLGLPDAVLGSAWPIISVEFDAPLASMGIITIIISAGTIVSSLFSDRLIKKIGVQAIAGASIAATAVAMLGFSFSGSMLALCLWAIPYGLGAGSVDAALNNYVAVHFESKHMSWLHCMWGVGATTGPYIMGFALTGNLGFRGGYQILFGIQAVLAIVILCSRRAWQTKSIAHHDAQMAQSKVLSLREIVRIAGVPQIMMAFFCFCAIEQTAGLWASTYLVYNRGVSAETAASFAALFYLGITVGRGISGFISMKFTDTQMIRFGAVAMMVGVLILLLPLGQIGAFVGLLTVGFGSSPVFPCIIHSTPGNFGVQNSQAITGVQMAAAYTGILIMPALFGLIADNVSVRWYPYFIGILIIGMAVLYESVLRKVKQ